MKFLQKRSSYQAYFDFQDSGLEYVFMDDGVKKGAFVPYSEIPDRWVYSRKGNLLSYMRGGFIVFLFGMLFIDAAIAENADNVIQLLLILSGLVVIIIASGFFYRKPTLSFFATVPEVVVIHDKKYQLIMDEISRRWRESQREDLNNIDLQLDPLSRSHKLFWLLRSGIINRHEYDDAIAKLMALKVDEL